MSSTKTLSLKQRVVLTILYSDLFDFPLKQEEIEQRLINKGMNGLVSIKSSSKKLKIESENNSLSQTLLELQQQGFLFSYQGYYSCKSNIIELVKSRKKRKIYSQKKLEEAQKVVSFLKKIPFISAVGVTGSVAVKNAVENDDIDFFIVTKNHSLWLVRFFVTIFAFFAGKKRNQNSKTNNLASIDNTWCFNLWLEESSLQLDKKRHNLYSAYEISQIHWLLDRNDIKSKLNYQNTFVGDFLTLKAEKSVKNFEQFHNEPNYLIKFLNYVFYLFQFWYMKNKITNEEVTINKAFFHPRPTKNLILKKLDDSYKNLDSYKAKNNKQLPLHIKSILTKVKNTAENSNHKPIKSVLVTGVFDVLHSAHVQFLRKAQELGDILIIAIESDIRVKKMKGENRPVNNEMLRLANLVRLNITPYVFIISEKFDSNQDYTEFMKAIKPDYYAVSSHTKYIDNKRKIVESVGGKLEIVLEHDKNISTSKILDNPRNKKSAKMSL